MFKVGSGLNPRLVAKTLGSKQSHKASEYKTLLEVTMAPLVH